jgi:hypothetical protein
MLDVTVESKIFWKLNQAYICMLCRVFHFPVANFADQTRVKLSGKGRMGSWYIYLLDWSFGRMPHGVPVILT